MAFYGNFTDEDRELMARITERFPKIFKRCHMADNNFLVGKVLSYMEEPRFLGALQRNAKTVQEQSLAVRLNTLVWAFDNALHLEGDIVECGVLKAFSFRFLTDYFDFANIDKTLWLYDTFDGIPPEYDADKLDAAPYHEQGLYEGVVAHFAAMPNVKVVKGVLPASLIGASPEKISLLHLDLNSVRAEIETLDALFDRIVPGGMIVFDDYGWMFYKNQHEAEKAWAAERGYLIHETANGQGILLKR